MNIKELKEKIKDLDDDVVVLGHVSISQNCLIDAYDLTNDEVSDGYDVNDLETDGDYNHHDCDEIKSKFTIFMIERC